MRKRTYKAFYISTSMYGGLIIVILGLRHGELAGIKWSDIDENGILAHPAVHKQAGRNQRQ